MLKQKTTILLLLYDCVFFDQNVAINFIFVNLTELILKFCNYVIKTKMSFNGKTKNSTTEP